MTLADRLKHAWNAFTSNKDPTYNYGPSYARRTDRPRFHRGNERTIVTSVYNRIALDVAALDIKHVKLDDTNERFKEVIDDGLNKCLTLNPNKDQISKLNYLL